MANINGLVKIISVRVPPQNEYSSVKPENIGTPQMYDTPSSEGEEPHFYKNFPGDKFPAEEPDLNTPVDLATGSEAGERLRKAIQSFQSQNK